MVSHGPSFDACSFRAGAHCFAVDSDYVAEVLHSATLTPVPLAPEAVVGLLHLRGRIVPVIDIGRRLGLDSPQRAACTHLVIRLGDDWYSLLVDEVLDVQAIPINRIERTTAGAVSASIDVMTGVFVAETRLIHILDLERLIQSLLKQRTTPFVRHGVSHGR